MIDEVKGLPDKKLTCVFLQVTGVVGRADVLAAMFFILSLACYFWAVQTTSQTLMFGKVCVMISYVFRFELSLSFCSCFSVCYVGRLLCYVRSTVLLCWVCVWPTMSSLPTGPFSSGQLLSKLSSDQS